MADNSRIKYFPHLAGSLVLASAGVMAYLGKWEGAAEYRVYADKLAAGIPTVCKGLTRHVTKTPIIVGEVWPAEKCEREEAQAVIAVQTALAMCFKRLPPQGVFDMASSHAWNQGAPATCGSVAMQRWNAGAWEDGCERMSHDREGKYVWSYVRTGRMLPNGKPELKFVQGLANRRDDETRKCLGALQ